jgi:hypothetical protein
MSGNRKPCNGSTRIRILRQDQRGSRRKLPEPHSIARQQALALPERQNAAMPEGRSDVDRIAPFQLADENVQTREDSRSARQTMPGAYPGSQDPACR